MQPSGRVGPGASFICVSFALLAVLGESVRSMRDLVGGGLLNPDSYMRLVRLRATLASGMPVYDVARDSSGHGTLLHWSHLLDSLLCVLALPFRLVLGPDDALHAAAVSFGPLSIAVLGFAIAWAAAPFAVTKWLWFGAILAPLSPAIASYGVAGVVHHHVGVVIVVVACWGWAARLISGHARPGAGIALGAWIGLGVWLTPETVPLTMMSLGGLALAWIISAGRPDIGQGIGQGIGLSGISFALVTMLALLVDPPAAGISAAEIDRLSIVFLGMALAVCLSGIGLWSVHRLVLSWHSRGIAAGAIGLFCCGSWVIIFWQAIFRSEMVAEQARLDAMFGHIVEMAPVDDVSGYLHFLLTGLLAFSVVTALALRHRSIILGYTAVCLTILLVLGWSHVRFSAYPQAAGAVALPIALTLASTATEAWPRIGQTLARMTIVILFVQGPYLALLPGLFRTAPAAAAAEAHACAVKDAIALLTPHSNAVVLADVNDTPEILYKTRLRTVGSLYHRNVEAFLRARAAWRSPASRTAPPEIGAAEISLVLACQGGPRSALVEGLTTENLYDQSRTGHPPPWLRRIGDNPVSGHVLYEVIRPGENGDVAASRP